MMEHTQYGVDELERQIAVVEECLNNLNGCGEVYSLILEGLRLLDDRLELEETRLQYKQAVLDRH